MARAETAMPEPVELQLEVKVNGFPLNLIAAFMQSPDGEIASTRGELAELGVAAPGEGPPDELVALKQCRVCHTSMTIHAIHRTRTAQFIAPGEGSDRRQRANSSRRNPAMVWP